MPQAAPFGSWRSPISAAAVAAGAVRLGATEVVEQDVYWLEHKPLEGGRYVLMRQTPQGDRSELTPAPFNVRTRVHEYGGGAYVLHGSSVIFSNFGDQRLYRVDPGAEPRPLTAEPEVPSGERYADGRVTPDGRLLMSVQERHPSDGSEAINELVVLPTDGSAPPRVIIAGNDFYSSPRISPDGSQMVWQCWNHPLMPWDGNELWLADLEPDGSLREARQVAGGPTESICQPEWSPSGVLHFISDRTGWWNLYCFEKDGVRALAPMEAEFGGPQWNFGSSTYAFLGDGRVACVYARDGFEHLGFLRPDRPLEAADSPYTVYAGVRASGKTLAFVAASPTEAAAVVRMDTETGQRQVLKRSVEQEIDPSYVSSPRPITFPTHNGRAEAYALYYPPTNADFVGPEGERPPLIVDIHGGPTSMATASLSVEKQFWTSRGFGVVDVNYSGSSGFGRAYRDRLQGTWGIVDVEDCVNAARFLAEQGDVDGRRLAIHGGSAGGYTTLCALVFHDDFSAGASYYGVADCEALAKDTHKFESRYLDGLIGPYPEARDVYRARSPIHFVDQISCPVILLQGLEDRVVPPSQAEAMLEALRAKDMPVAYLAFEGEQHGFRRASTIQRAMEAELYFYSRVFRFTLAEPVEPVEIENLP